MKNKDSVRVSVRLSEEEKVWLERSAKICGLSQSEFVRQLCKGKTPKPQPTKEFWELLEALYEVHKGFKACAKYEPSALNICKEIECLILDFINAIRRFMEMQKLTAPLLRELIDEITVYETEGVGKNRSQRIMIHYKFIGYIEIPECGSNYKADTRKGVAVEYITKSA